MPSEGTDDDGDSGEEERDYTAYKRAKNDRANDPDEAGPRDPAAEMWDEHRDGETGFEDMETNETVKSMQERLAGIAEDVDFLGLEEAEDGEKVRLSLTEADIEEAHQSPEERREALLRGIQAELHALNRQAEFGGSGGDSGAATGVSKHRDDAVELLGQIEDELEGRERQRRQAGPSLEQLHSLMEGEEAEVVDQVLTAYTEADEDNSREDGLAGLAEWVQEVADDMEDDEEARRLLAARASLENTVMDGDGSAA